MVPSRSNRAFLSTTEISMPGCAAEYCVASLTSASPDGVQSSCQTTTRVLPIGLATLTGQLVLAAAVATNETGVVVESDGMVDGAEASDASVVETTTTGKVVGAVDAPPSPPPVPEHATSTTDVATALIPL